MARTITLDGISMMEVRVTRDEKGQIQVFGRYDLLSSGRVVQTVHKDITSSLNASRRSAAASLFEGMTSDVSGFELS